MKHGETRNHHRKETITTDHYVDGAGNPVTVTYVSSSSPACETWCAKCQAWIPCEGLISHIICQQCSEPF